MIEKKDIKDRNIILFGVGATQKATLSLFDKYFTYEPSNILMIDKLDYTNHPTVKSFIDRGSKYLMCDINENYIKIISKLKKADIIIDLSNRTDSLKIAEECLKNNIHYINTSLEDVESPNVIKKKDEKLKNSYQYSHNQVNTLKNSYKDNSTILLCAGMNPGLITICTKLAILFLANDTPKDEKLNLYINDRDWGNLCEYLEIEIIHCSEIDTVEYNKKSDYNDKFNNTWCCNALLDEYSDDVQLTWGTEQKKLPEGAEMMSDYVVNLYKPAEYVYCESYVPIYKKIIGCCISHSESISGADYWSTPTHSPTVHYVYKFSPITFRSVQKLNRKYIGGTLPNKDSHVLNNLEDDIYGYDIVGSLIITKDKKSVWCGSILDNKDSEVGLNQATTLQVAIAINSFLHWILDNPNKGVNFPESVEENYMIPLLKPYFGLMVDYVDYKPKSLQFDQMRRTKEQFDKQFK